MDNKSNSAMPSSGGVDLNLITAWMGDIRKQVGEIALLHERSTNNERKLAETEERTASALERIEQQIVRVHERMDFTTQSVTREVSSVRDELRLAGERYRAETADQIAKAIDPIWKKVDDQSSANKDTRRELDGWVNRAKGAWFIGSICAGVFQAFIVAALIWATGEIKIMHDWRIMQEAHQAARKKD